MYDFSRMQYSTSIYSKYYWSITANHANHRKRFQHPTTLPLKFWMFRSLLRTWQFPRAGGQSLAKQNPFVVHYGMMVLNTIAQKYCLHFTPLHSIFTTVTRKSGRLRKRLMTTQTILTRILNWSTVPSPRFDLLRCLIAVRRLELQRCNSPRPIFLLL